MVLSNLDDQRLVALYMEGKDEAFDVLLYRHKNQLFKFIYLKVKDRDLAEDLFQEAFVKIINTLKLGNYNEEGKFLPWAMRIAHNLVIDHFRKANRFKVLSERNSKSEDFNIFSILPSEDSNYLQATTKDELEAQIAGLIHYLPEVQQDIVMKRIYQDMSFKEIADNEGISINTALGRMRYALINLRKLIEKHQLVVETA